MEKDKNIIILKKKTSNKKYHLLKLSNYRIKNQFRKKEE